MLAKGLVPLLICFGLQNNFSKSELLSINHNQSSFCRTFLAHSGYLIITSTDKLMEIQQQASPLFSDTFSYSSSSQVFLMQS